MACKISRMKNNHNKRQNIISLSDYQTLYTSPITSQSLLGSGEITALTDKFKNKKINYFVKGMLINKILTIINKRIMIS